MTGRVLFGSGGSEARRQFTDAEGLRWTVAQERIPRDEWTSADEDNHRAGDAVGWLHFGCAECRRRLRLFPSLWLALSDAELDRLCRRAREVPPS